MVRWSGWDCFPFGWSWSFTSSSSVYAPLFGSFGTPLLHHWMMQCELISIWSGWRCVCRVHVMFVCEVSRWLERIEGMCLFPLFMWIGLPLLVCQCVCISCVSLFPFTSPLKLCDNKSCKRKVQHLSANGKEREREGKCMQKQEGERELYNKIK